MARFTVASALLALSSLVSAQTPGYHAITKPGLSEEVKAGSTYTITWTYAPAFTGNVVLALIGGDTQGTQVPLYSIGSADGSTGQLAWNVDCAYKGQAFYGLTITSVDNPSVFQYSTPFKVVDSDACSSSSSASSSASATVTATLSSVSSSSTHVVHVNATSTTTTCDSSSSYAHTTSLAPHYNTTMATSKTGAVVTSTAYSTAAGTTGAGATPSVPVEAGATRVGSSIVMLAGVAAAFFVL